MLESPIVGDSQSDCAAVKAAHASGGQTRVVKMSLNTKIGICMAESRCKLVVVGSRRRSVVEVQCGTCRSVRVWP